MKSLKGLARDEFTRQRYSRTRTRRAFSYFRARLYRGREENHGRESDVKRIVPRRGTSVRPDRPARGGRASRRARSRSPASGRSLGRPRRVPVARPTFYVYAVAGYRRPIFSPGRRERRVYGRAQNGRRQERSTVRERERAGKPRFSLSPLLSR